MKKVLFAIIMAISASVANAGEYLGVTFGNGTDTKTDQHSGLATVTYGQTNGAWDVEGRAGTVRQARTATNDNFVEGRVRYNWTFDKIKPWVRGTFGDQINNGMGQYTYWGVEPGVGFQFTPTFRIDGSYLRRQAITNSVNDDRKTWIAAATFDLDKRNSLVGRYLSSTDLVKANTFEIGYVRSF